MPQSYLKFNWFKILVKPSGIRNPEVTLTYEIFHAKRKLVDETFERVYTVGVYM